MNFIKQNKTLIGGVVVLVLAFIIYSKFFSGGSSTAPALTASSTPTVSQNLLSELQSLHTITLDNSIFQNPVFVSLTDFGVTIPPESAGRQDPFLPATASSNATSAPALNLPSGATSAK